MVSSTLLASDGHVLPYQTMKYQETMEKRYKRAYSKDSINSSEVVHGNEKDKTINPINNKHYNLKLSEECYQIRRLT